MSSTELKTESVRPGVASVIARRVSCRAFNSDPVPDDHVRQIIEAARLAPSACNMQPWRFAVVRDPELRRRVVADGSLNAAGAHLRQHLFETRARSGRA